VCVCVYVCVCGRAGCVEAVSEHTMECASCPAGQSDKDTAAWHQVGAQSDSIRGRRQSQTAQGRGDRVRQEKGEGQSQAGEGSRGQSQAGE
jgi:hypothetical protein